MKNTSSDQSGDGVRQHVRLAISGGDPQEGGTFGIESPFKGEPDRAIGRSKLRDHERAAGKPVKHTKGMAPSQAAPDHGPME